MVLLGLQAKVKEVESGLARLDGTAVQYVVEETEQSPAPVHAETGRWSYWAPFPGVRYYYYEELLL